MTVEYQVVHGDGDVEGSLSFKEAKAAFEADKQATELRKVIWHLDKDGEPIRGNERDDITIQEREIE